MLTDLELCNAALVKLGCATIASFEEETTEASVALSFYEITRDALLVTHPWSFAVKTSTLRRFDVPMDCSHNHGFRIPDDFIKVISSGCAAYQISGEHLFSNDEWVTLTYIKCPDESEFPSYFVSALINRLAAEFCGLLTENASRSDLLFKLADTELKLAKLIDSQQDEPRREDDFSLAETE